MSGVVKPVPAPPPDPLDDLGPGPSPFAWRGQKPDPLYDLGPQPKIEFRPPFLSRVKEAGQYALEHKWETAKGMVLTPSKSAAIAGAYASQSLHQNPDRLPISDEAGRGALLETGANLLAPQLGKIPGVGGVAAGAGIGAAYSREDPLVGAAFGGALGGAAHVGAKAIARAFQPKVPFEGAPTPESATRMAPDETVIHDPEFVPERPAAPVPKLLPAAGQSGKPGPAAPPAPEPPPAWWPAGHEAEWYARDPLADLSGASAPPNPVTPVPRETAVTGLEKLSPVNDIAPRESKQAASNPVTAPAASAPQPYQSLPPMGGAEGRPTQVLLRDGQALPAVYRVVPAASLTPSHDPFTFQKNPNYPAGVQARNYDTNPAMQDVVTAQGMNYDARTALNPSESATEGQPTVLPNGVVLAGNTRTMHPQIAQRFAPENYQAYVDELKRRASEYGVDPAHIDQVEDPVLVRMLTHPNDIADNPGRWQAINRLSDETGTKAKTAIESGAGMAQRLALAPEALEHFATTVDPEQTIAKYLEGPGGRQFTKLLVEHDVIPPEQQGRFLADGGGLTTEGKTAVRHMMLVAAVTDPQVFDHTTDEAILKIEHAIPSVISTKGSAFDLSGPLTGALRALGDARATGQTLSDLRDQRAMFDFGTQDPEAHQLAQFIDDHTKKAITEAFRRFGTLAREATGNAASHDMFGGTGYDRAKAFAAVFGSDQQVAARRHRAAGPPSSRSFNIGEGEVTPGGPQGVTAALEKARRVLDDPTERMWARAGKPSQGYKDALGLVNRLHAISAEEFAARQSDLKSTEAGATEHAPGQQDMFGPEDHAIKANVDEIMTLARRYATEHGVTVAEAVDALEEDEAARDNMLTPAAFDAARRELGIGRGEEPPAQGSLFSRVSRVGDLPSQPGLSVHDLDDHSLVEMRKALEELLAHFRANPEGLKPGATALYEADARVLDAEAVRRGLAREGTLEAPIRGFHGSPFRFDQFSLQQIGSGEGAQAYGWGLYIAGKKAVGEYYRDLLGESPGFVHLSIGGIPVKAAGAFVHAFQWDIGGRPPTADETNVARVMIDEVAQHELELARLGRTDGKIAVKQAIHRMIGRLEDTYTREWPSGQAALATFKAAVSAPGGVSYELEKPEGHLYHVEGPDEADMLDGDKPLLQQPQAVQDAVRMALKADGYLDAKDNGPRQLKRAFDAWRSGVGSGGDHGMTAYRILENAALRYDGNPVNALFKTLGKEVSGAEAASRYLASKGVPGIRYKDEQSRGSPGGTRNYVIFDDQLLKIMKVEAKRAGVDQQQMELWKAGHVSDEDATIINGSPEERTKLEGRMAAMAGDMRDDLPGFPSSATRLAAIAGKKASMVSIKGQKVSSLQDLHRLLVPFRDPYAEHLGTQYYHADGTIADFTLDTSGAITHVRLGPIDTFWDAMGRRAQRLGVTEVSLHHNHPDGNPAPSNADQFVLQDGTAYLRDKYGVKVRGMYIIDHEKGNWLQGHPASLRVPWWLGDPDELASHGLTPSLDVLPVNATGLSGPGPDWTQKHGFKLGSAEDLHEIVMQSDPETSLTVAYMSTEARVVAVQGHPIDRLDTIKDWLLPQIQAHGAFSVALVVPSRGDVTGWGPLYDKRLIPILHGPLASHIWDVGVVSPAGADASAVPFITSLGKSGRIHQPPPAKDANPATRTINAPLGRGPGSVGGGPPREPGDRASTADQVPPEGPGAGIVQKAETFLRRAADFWATAWHDPLARARRFDAQYAELGDRALAAKPFAGHFARTMAGWTDEGLTPKESETLSRVQIVNRLREINARETHGQMEFIPDDAGELEQRRRTIARYSAMIPPKFLEAPNIQQALARRMQIYKDVMEPAAIEGNVDPAKFSRSSTGHIKLVPLSSRDAIPGGETMTPPGQGGATKTAQAAQRAKGLALDYETDWETVLASDARDKFQAAASNRFARGTVARGRELPPGSLTVPGEIKVQFADPANIIPDFGPKITVALPKSLAQAHGHVTNHLARKGAATSDLGAFLRTVDSWAGRLVFTANPGIFVNHSKNLAGMLGSIPEAGPMGWATALSGTIPGTKVVRGITEMLTLDMRTPQALGTKMRLASVGALRPVELSYVALGEQLAKAKKNALMKFGDQLSPDMKRQIQKLSVFGENGLDERARVAIAMKYLAQEPHASDAALGQYVNRIAGNYTKGLGGVVVDLLQHAKFSMFARVQTAKLGLGARALVGRSLLPTHSPAEATELWIKQLLLGPLGNKLGLKALIAGLSLLLAKQLTQAPGKENDIPTGQKTDDDRDVYVRGAFGNPMDAVTQELGIDAAARGDTRGAIQAVKNTALSIGTSNPIARTAFSAFTGDEPNVDRQGHPRPLGSPNLSGLPRLKAIAKVGTGLTAAAAFGPDANRNPGLPPKIGKALSYVGANVTTAAGAPSQAKESAERQDVMAFQSGAVADIFHAKTLEAREAVMADAVKQAARYGLEGPKLQALLQRALHRAGVDRSERGLTRFTNLYLGGKAP